MGDNPRDRALVMLARDRGEALTRYAYLFTGDVAAAQDLVQDALVKVFVKTHAGRELEALEAYVRRAIATLYIDGFRRRRSYSQVQHLLANPEAGSSSTSAEALDLRAALATLSPQERAAVVLRYFEDLTVPDAAEAMGLAEGTVKRYLSNAIHKLEQRLGAMPSLAIDGGHQHVPVTPHRGGRS